MVNTTCIIGDVSHALMANWTPDEGAFAERISRSKKFVFSTEFVDFDLHTSGVNFSDQLSEHGLLRLPFPEVVFQVGPIYDEGEEYYWVLSAWEVEGGICARLYHWMSYGQNSPRATTFFKYGSTFESHKRHGVITQDQYPILGCHFDLDDSEVCSSLTMMVLYGCLGVLNSSGVKQRSYAEPKFTNKRRAKKGKAPKFGFNWIEIDKSQIKMPGMSGPTGASPRLHWRRGHVRRLKSGKLTVVKPCLVGSLSSGFVDSSYSMGKSAGLEARAH
jgi:hypothetical protein